MTVLRLIFVLALILGITACGTMRVVINPRPSIVEVGTSVTFTATVSNDSLNGGVEWSLTGAGEIVTASSGSIVYNAPESLPSNISVTIRAVAVDDTAASDSVTFTLQ